MAFKIQNHWWREKLIEAFIVFGYKAELGEIEKYFREHYESYILKSVDSNNIEASINGQLQYCSKKNGGQNYQKQKRKYDLFYKIEKGLWALRKDYEDEVNKYKLKLPWN